MIEIESINLRIKKLIDDLNIRKTAFADKINVSQAFVSQLCSGASQPSDRTIADICREFNVSEVWLRTGEGEMFVPMTKDEKLLEVLADLQVDETNPIRDLLIGYWQLEENEKEVIKKLLRKILDKKKDGQ